MFCKNCGTKVTGQEKFCPNCGTAVENTSAETNKQSTEKIARQQISFTMNKNIIGVAAAVVVLLVIIFAVGGTRKGKGELDTKNVLSIAEELSSANIGDYVTFGTYEQDNNLKNGAEAIEWQVLDKKDGKVLLLSKYALDCEPYHEEYVYVTWETCTLRSWLNEEFYKTAFTNAEQKYIAETYVINEDNPDHGTDGGNNTYDNVFLLSIDEVGTYFDSDLDAYDPARRAQVTEYAKAQGGGYDYNKESEYYGNGLWWLRSPGDFSNLAAGVIDGGLVDRLGIGVDRDNCVVRPALWVEVE